MVLRRSVPLITQLPSYHPQGPPSPPPPRRSKNFVSTNFDEGMILVCSWGVLGERLCISSGLRGSVGFQWLCRACCVYPVLPYLYGCRHCEGKKTRLSCTLVHSCNQYVPQDVNVITDTSCTVHSDQRPAEVLAIFLFSTDV